MRLFVRISLFGLEGGCGGSDMAKRKAAGLVIVTVTKTNPRGQLASASQMLTLDSGIHPIRPDRPFAIVDGDSGDGLGYRRSGVDRSVSCDDGWRSSPITICSDVDYDV